VTPDRALLCCGAGTTRRHDCAYIARPDDAATTPASTCEENAHDAHDAHDAADETAGTAVHEGVAAARDGGLRLWGTVVVTGATAVAESPLWPAPIGERRSTARHPPVLNRASPALSLRVESATNHSLSRRKCIKVVL
jgi:hypothetical protein